MFCSVEGCGRPLYAKGFCVAHYFRDRKGDVQADVPIRPKNEIRLCEIDDCDREHFSRGMCELHYRRWKRGGTTKRIAPSGLTGCSVKGCTKVSQARGLCHGHYQRLIRGSSLTDEVPLVRPPCSIEGCDRRASPRTALCPTHLQRRQKTGSAQPEKPIRVVEGKGSVNHGYLYVPVPRSERHLANGRQWIQEHRLVMARILGRPLTREESVHHLDGDRLNNSPENLELWIRSQPAGQRLSDRIEHARLLLAQYADELGHIADPGSTPRTSSDAGPAQAT
jgi:hypothetical protein